MLAMRVGPYIYRRGGEGRELRVQPSTHSTVPCRCRLPEEISVGGKTFTAGYWSISVVKSHNWDHGSVRKHMQEVLGGISGWHWVMLPVSMNSVGQNGQTDSGKKKLAAIWAKRSISEISISGDVNWKPYSEVLLASVSCFLSCVPHPRPSKHINFDTNSSRLGNIEWTAKLGKCISLSTLLTVPYCPNEGQSDWV